MVPGHLWLIGPRTRITKDLKTILAGELEFAIGGFPLKTFYQTWGAGQMELPWKELITTLGIFRAMLNGPQEANSKETGGQII